MSVDVIILDPVLKIVALITFNSSTIFIFNKYSVLDYVNKRIDKTCNSKKAI